MNQIGERSGFGSSYASNSIAFVHSMACKDTGSAQAHCCSSVLTRLTSEAVTDNDLSLRGRVKPMHGR